MDYDSWNPEEFYGPPRKLQTPEEFYGPPKEIHCIKCGDFFGTYDDLRKLCEPCMVELSEYDGRKEREK